ncbi:MAG TPA: hypothetical protein VNO30_10705 [Kofleriaceae bacterium]|nr:hypothetical protein [Kofleriaceae bacterium]
MPSELDQPQDAIDTALTAVMYLDTRLDRLAGHDSKPRTRTPAPGLLREIQASVQAHADHFFMQTGIWIGLTVPDEI